MSAARSPLLALLAAPASGLAWLGRQGTRAIAGVVIVGVAVPPIDALLRPFVTEAIFALLCIAFLRIDPAALRGYLGRPAIVIAATAWTMLAMPAVFGASCLLIGLDAKSPDLFLALMLQAVAPPMMASPAFAAVMGLDATLVLVTLVASMVLTPITAPLFVYWFVGPALSMSALALGIKLFAILAGSALTAAVLRRISGAAVIAKYREEIDGLNVVAVFVFVAAVMENVASQFLAEPLLMSGLAALAFALNFTVLALTALAFAGAGRERAFVLGMMASQRNMGLMLAATGGVLPDLTWLYFALCQFPIYLSPQMLKPLARGLIVRAS